MATIAIFSTGGKQYKVQVGDTLKVEKLAVKDGEKVEFPALLVADEKQLLVMPDDLKKAKVVAQIQGQVRGKKLFGVKHKAKKRQLKKFGHRQRLTELQIVDIVVK